MAETFFLSSTGYKQSINKINRHFSNYVLKYYCFFPPLWVSSYLLCVLVLQGICICNNLLHWSTQNISLLKDKIFKFYLWRHLVDSHWLHCTEITKQLNFYARLVTWVDPYTLQGKSLSKSGEVLCHKHWSDRNSPIHPRNVKAFTWWLCNQ